MELKQLAICMMFAFGIAACGGSEFVAFPDTDLDAASDHDAASDKDVAQPVESGKDAKQEADAKDAGHEAKPESSVPDAAGEKEADAPIPDVVSEDVTSVESGEDAKPEAETDAAPEAAEDAAEEQVVVPESGPDVVEPEDVIQVDADPCPNGGILNVAPGDCGNAPASGLWICYVLPHIPTCGSVGLAGGNPPIGQLPDPYYHDPMIVMGGPCVAGSAQDGFVLCQLPAPSGTKVFGTAGLHQPVGPTLPDRFACDSQTCRGRALVYKNGAEIGGMQNSAGYGAVSLVDFQGRKNLLINAP